MFRNRRSVWFELLIKRLVDSKKSFRSFYSASSSSEDEFSKSEDSRTIILLIESTKTLWSAVSVPMDVNTSRRTRRIIFSRSSSLSSWIWNLFSSLYFFGALNLLTMFWKKLGTLTLFVESISHAIFVNSWS